MTEDRIKFSKSERFVLRGIRKYTQSLVAGMVYHFDFVYNMDSEATSWEGGINLPTNVRSRNTYSMVKGEPVYYTKIG